MVQAAVCHCAAFHRHQSAAVPPLTDLVYGKSRWNHITSDDKFSYSLRAADRHEIFSRFARLVPDYTSHDLRAVIHSLRCNASSDKKARGHMTSGFGYWELDLAVLMEEMRRYRKEAHSRLNLSNSSSERYSVL